MISCIICSRQADISAELKENIESTIGCEYELVVIDNSKNDYSIFSAYNEGVRRAKGDILCFMHEDILYHTQGWGMNVYNHFTNCCIGLIGIVGGHCMPDFPASWFTMHTISGQNLQGVYRNSSYTTDYYLFDKRKIGNSAEVVAVDGMWFCVPKCIFEKIRFDSVTFNHFHCYDLDISMQVIKNNLQVHVVFDILIEHKSPGNIDVTYFLELDKFYEKWCNYFPLIRGGEFNNILDMNEKLFLAKQYMSLLRENVYLRHDVNKMSSSFYYKLRKKIKKIYHRILRI